MTFIALLKKREESQVNAPVDLQVNTRTGGDAGHRETTISEYVELLAGPTVQTDQKR